MRLNNPPRPLPLPSKEELDSCQPLVNMVCHDIESNGGKLSFSQFMEKTLYAPGVGYYNSDKQIFGDSGDYITAPEMTPLFSRCVARQALQVLNELGNGDIIEFGAGAGTMACDILIELESQNALPNHYFIGEVSNTLKERQRDNISQRIPHLLERVKWVNDMPDGFRGVVVGNEVLDAMPVHRVRFNQNGKHDEVFVTYQNNSLEWIAGKPSCKLLKTTLDEVFQKFGDKLPDHYETEINLAANAWTKNIADKIEQGLVLLIDYGFSENEFFRPERHEGTLMCHYRHCAHGDALTHIGLQDITSHVNFTAIAQSAYDAGLSVSGFTNQTYFLISCGLETFLSEIDINDTKLFLKQTQPVKQLILPDEMGDLFKAIGLTKNFDHPLIGFTANNNLERL